MMITLSTDGATIVRRSFFGVIFAIFRIVTVLWSLILLYIYLGEVHRISGWKLFIASYLFFLVVVVLIIAILTLIGTLSM